MKDEIKEIITRMASYTIHYDCCSEGDAEEDIDKLLDYITNLQQIEQDHKQTNATLMSELIKLEEENEELKKDYSKAMELIEKAIDKLTIKQARFINEKGYVLDDNDLDEIMYILQNGSEKE